MLVHKRKTKEGFTIVELLIVIVIIGALTAIVVRSYGNTQAKARNAVATDTVKELGRTLRLTLISNSQYDNVGAITDPANPGTPWTSRACTEGSLDMRKLPKTHQCWTDYLAALERIRVAAGLNLSNVRDGDPWGSPYVIDENEGEPLMENGVMNCYRRDMVSSAGPNGIWSDGTWLTGAGEVGADDIRYFLPRSKVASDC